jgi:hypothetical protein
MIIVPVGKDVSAELYPKGFNSMVDDHNYVLLDDWDKFAIMSCKVAKRKYWAWYTDPRSGEKWWCGFPYQNDFVLSHLDQYYDLQVESWTTVFVWCSGHLRPCFRRELYREFSIYECDWILPVISTLMSSSPEAYRKLLRSFNRSDIDVKMSRVGSVIMYDHSQYEGYQTSFHHLIHHQYVMRD